MAYFSQQMKKEREPAIKALLKEYKIKGRLGVNHHSTLVLNITEGEIDFLGNYCENRGGDQHPANKPNGYIDVNEYYISDSFTGRAREFLHKIKDAMMVGNWDNSRPEYDHFDKGFYIQIRIGKWNDHYCYNKPQN